MSLFYFVIGSALLYWIARGETGDVRSLIEYRTLASFPQLHLGEMKLGLKYVLQGKPLEAWQYMEEQFSSMEFQNEFEIAISDQFPLRTTWIQIAYGFDRGLIRASYLPVDTPAIPADMKASQIYMIKDQPVLFQFPKSFTPREIESIDITISSYNRLLQQHPDINFYVYYIERIDYSHFNPIINENFNADKGQTLSYFETHLPAGLHFGNFTLNGFEDHLKYYYRTDHHWNIHGTLQAYEMIYHMLAENYPDISPMLAHDNVYTFPDISFHGSFSRRTLYRLNPADKFEVALVDLPSYRILDVNGFPMELNHMEEYLAGKYSTRPFTDHYIEYYGADTDLVEFIFDNQSKRNLLIIGDSYVNSIETLLASHYSHTYSVDIRNYPDEFFSLSDFLISHDVDDILFLGGAWETINQSRWTIDP